MDDGLRGVLRSIDGSPFQAYRKILGDHAVGDFRLTVLWVPPDPLGGPARVRLSIDRRSAGLDGDWAATDDARAVLEDAIVRAAARAIDEQFGPPVAVSPGSGRIGIDPPGHALALRTNARVGDATVDVALSIDLPAAARRVRGVQAESVLFDALPRVGMAALLFPLRRADELKPLIAAQARRRDTIAALPSRGLAALLSRPPKGAGEALSVPTGITLFVSNGVSGTGAWLRQLVADSEGPAADNAMFASPVCLIRPARHTVGPIDLAAFVRACPEVPEPEGYENDDAPAPLAVAASIVEAVEAGARILVIDEDEIPAGVLGRVGPSSSLGKGDPPLIPLAERLAELRDHWGVSFLIAARATSGFYDLADSVFVVDGDTVEDARERTRDARTSALIRQPRPAPPLSRRPAARTLRIASEAAPHTLKIAAWGGRGVRVGEDLIDLQDTPLVREPARLRAIAALLKRAAIEAAAWRPVEELLDVLEAAANPASLHRLEEPGLVDLERPSRVEIAAALVRWKRVEFRVAAVRLRRNAEDLP